MAIIGSKVAAGLLLLLAVAHGLPVTDRTINAEADNEPMSEEQEPVFETLGSQYWEFLIDSLPTINLYLHRLDNCIQIVKERQIVEQTKLYIEGSGEDLESSQIKLCKVSIMLYEEQQVKESKDSSSGEGNKSVDALNMLELKETYNTLVNGPLDSIPDQEQGNPLGLPQDYSSIAENPLGIKPTYITAEEDSSSISAKSVGSESSSSSNEDLEELEKLLGVSGSSKTATPKPTTLANAPSTNAAPKPTTQANASSTTAAPKPTTQADVRSTTAALQPSVQADVPSTTTVSQPAISASTTSESKPSVDDESIQLEERLLQKLIKGLRQEGGDNTQ